MRALFAAAVVAVAATPLHPCPVLIEVHPLWDSVAMAEGVVVGRFSCASIRWEERIDSAVAAEFDRREVEARAAFEGDSSPSDESWRDRVFAVVREVRVHEVWHGTIREREIPVTNRFGWDSEACGEPDGASWVTDERLIFLDRRDDGWSYFEDVSLPKPDRPAARRSLRRTIGALADLQSTGTPEWAVLDWLADAIADPLTRATGLRDGSWPGWLRPELDPPPAPVELLSAAQRDRIAAAFVADPMPDDSLPEMLELIGDSPDPMVLSVALDTMGAALEDAEGGWDLAQSLYYWFPEAVAWFGVAWDCPWAAAWSEQLDDLDSGFLLEDVQAVWPEARARIEEAIRIGRVPVEP